MDTLTRFSDPPRFDLTEALFLRLLGFVYLAAFASWWPQIVGLLGNHGIVPVANELVTLHNELGAKAYYYVPSLYWFNASNAALTGVCILGCISALMLLSGLFSRYTAAVCFLLYLSITTAGQPFSNFQWDALLLECGFLALFSGAPWLIWAYRFLLFRLMFESGVVKLTSGDPNWRNLHALRYHFLTQPLPGPLAYYAYRLPNWILDTFTAVTLVIELVVPFLLFLPVPWRRIAGLAFIVLQVAILLTGNYAFFNLLTLTLCLWCFDEVTYLPLERILKRTFPTQTPLRPWFGRIANAVLAIMMIVGLVQAEGTAFPSSRHLARVITSPIDSLEVINSYGLFAVMTTTRPEIVLEGSNDLVHWTEYSFRFKPGDVHKRLPLVAPHQPRLDWQLWFAAMSTYQDSPWVGNLVLRLLRNEASVKALLDPIPFPSPPKYIRAVLYDYTFSNPTDRSRSGVIWQRERSGIWLQTVSLTDAY